MSDGERAFEAFLDAADRGELDADDTAKAWAYREARDRVDEACRDLIETLRNL